MIQFFSVYEKPAFAVLTATLLLAFPMQGNASDDEGDQVFARYARYGADIWAQNPSAKISGEGEACISCHTSLPYALVEPLLPGEYAAYSDLIENVSERAITWQNNTPWYSEKNSRNGGDTRWITSRRTQGDS